MFATRKNASNGLRPPTIAHQALIEPGKCLAGTDARGLRTFGRATRETVCSCEVKMEPTLSQALHLLNGDTTNNRIRQGRVIDEMLKEKMEPLQIVEQLYITCLTRKPTQAELDSIKPLFAEGSDVKQGLEDVFWALLNSREFLFNH